MGKEAPAHLAKVEYRTVLFHTNSLRKVAVSKTHSVGCGDYELAPWAPACCHGRNIANFLLRNSSRVPVVNAVYGVTRGEQGRTGSVAYCMRTVYRGG